MKVPRLIVSDVDGTLIDGSEHITEDFRRLASMIEEYNIPFTLASGRCYSELERFITSLQVDLPVIANNGTSAYLKGKELWAQHINPLHVKEAIHFADKLDMVIIMCDGVKETAYRHNAYIQNQIDTFQRYNHFHIPLKEEWPHLKLQKLLIIDPQKNGRIDQVIEQLEPYMDDLNVVQYDARSIDIMPKNCTKSSGITKLSNMLGIDATEMMTIGDAKNDIEMVSAAGIGVAVANASNSLKQRADYICKNNNVLGVIEAIEKFYLQHNLQ
ncbi:HAD family hydrolase [Paenibacillus sp. L3-i20]|uniref:HAD family hydrolase n=1 Tax=Paenibacillus sp. L3-i20 TaxID=2905833 RepID=UPI001EE0104F|nr:HAD family hydrolase [Paenibacillus sp. L3-i20]